MPLQVVFILQMLGQVAVSFAITIAFCDLAKTWFRLDGILAFCAALLLLGVAGYLAVMLGYADYRVFGVAKIVVLALLLLRFVVIVRRGQFPAYWEWLKEPLVFASLFTIAVLAIGYSNGGLEDPRDTPQTRFGHHLPIDNVIPFLIAEALKLDHIASPLYGDWLSSDRPPLQAGLYILLAIKTGWLGYQIIAAWLQSTFLFGVWGLCVMAELSARARRMTLLACCLLPVTILNTLYTWPKIIAVGYLLLVFALLFVHHPADQRERRVVGVLLGGLAALALLCHGTSAFVLIGLSVMVLILWRWPAWRTVGYGLATLLVMYLPWWAYQAFVDPPANRLLKWHLAGVQDVDPRPFGQTLRESYAALTWHDYVQGRLQNFATLYGRGIEHLRDLARVVVNHDPELAKALRVGDFFNFLPSLHGFAVALIVALALMPFMGAWPSQRAIALKLLGVVAATCVTYCILLFIPGAAVNHQATYAVHVMTAVAIFIVLGSRAPIVGLLFIALQSVTVGTLYGWMLPENPAYWPTLLICIAATLALFAFALMPFRRRRDAVAAAR
jgi:hypothetical protein